MLAVQFQIRAVHLKGERRITFTEEIGFLENGERSVVLGVHGDTVVLLQLLLKIILGNHVEKPP